VSHGWQAWSNQFRSALTGPQSQGPDTAVRAAIKAETARIERQTAIAAVALRRAANTWGWLVPLRLGAESNRDGGEGERSGARMS
jgi:hypothetical protein